MTDSLTKARLKLQAMQASGQKVVKLDPIAKAKANPNSLRDAITAACWFCAGSARDGEKFTRETIRECSVRACPLHPHRPYQPTEPEAA
jgi:hypothetical protein